jgi:hypothetical protein
MKVLIEISTNNLAKDDIKHAMIVIPNIYQIDSQLNDNIASILIVLLSNI